MGIERDWTAWWEGDLDRPMVVIGTLEFGGVMTVLDMGSWQADSGSASSDGAPPTTPVDELLDFHQSLLESARFYGDAFPRWWPNFGPGIVAGFLGARVNNVPGTVWFSPAERKRIGESRPTFDPDNVWWQRVRELTRAAVARWGDSVTVAHTDPGGNLDVLASLRETQQPPPEDWLPLLKRIRDGGKLCQVYVTREGARTIVHRLGGRGFAFIVLQPMSQEEAESFLRILAMEDANV